MRKLIVAAMIALATPAFAEGIGDILKPKPKTQENAPPPGPNQGKGIWGQPTQPTQPAQPNQPGKGIWGQPAAGAPDPARIAYDVALIELQASKLYLQGLSDMASRPASWDREHSVGLFNQAQRTVIRAEQSLGELEGLAGSPGGKPKAVEPLHQARGDLVQTEAQLRAFSQPVRSGQFQAQDQSSIKSLYESVDRAQKSLENAAGQLGMDAKVKGP